MSAFAFVYFFIFVVYRYNCDINRARETGQVFTVITVLNILVKFLRRQLTQRVDVVRCYSFSMSHPQNIEVGKKPATTRAHL
jgi:hypothetical protein